MPIVDAGENGFMNSVVDYVEDIVILIRDAGQVGRRYYAVEPGEMADIIRRLVAVTSVVMDYAIRDMFVATLYGHAIWLIAVDSCYILAALR